MDAAALCGQNVTIQHCRLRITIRTEQMRLPPAIDRRFGPRISLIDSVWQGG
jgi:hypothetical protein